MAINSSMCFLPAGIKIQPTSARTQPAPTLRRQQLSDSEQTAVALFDSPTSLLETGEEGLSNEEAASRLQRFGPNELPEKQENKFLKFLKEFVQPMPMMIWFAIGIELLEYNLEQKETCLVDAAVLLILQVLNVAIGFYEELKASEEISALRAGLKQEATVMRAGRVSKVSATDLVPGDRVLLGAGGAVPADCTVAAHQSQIQVDQAQLTGESLPVTMKPGDDVKMGSTVTRGECEAIVHGTGANTALGKTAAMINSVDGQPNFERVLQQLLVFLTVLGLGVCGIIFTFLMKESSVDVIDVLGFLVVLLVASIPVALRVVCTCTLAAGCKELAAEEAIVARLSAVEELAGMDILCSDKTGTLTLNKMMLQDHMPLFDEPRHNRESVLRAAALAARWWEPAKDALDTLVLNAVDGDKLTKEGYQQIAYEPFDPSTKRTESTVRFPDGREIKLMKGAPNVVLSLCDGNRDEVGSAVDSQVAKLASRGIRALGVASCDPGEKFRFIGLLTFLDPPRPDTKETIERASLLGVEVKMITGDHRAIAKETCTQLGMGSNIQGAENLPTLTIEEMSNPKPGGRVQTLGENHGEEYENSDGFAQVLPEHKYMIVEALRQRGHLVGMTGDGVNDAPALKRADVGIAVSGSTSAAQAAADIVLTREGLSTIITAIMTSRKIFQRMKNFVIYRVACTEQLLLFFFAACIFINPSAYNPEMFSADYFSIPVLALVSITILNDGTIVSVAYDNVQANQSPEKWNLESLYVVATAIGGTALMSSLLLLHLALMSNDPGSLWASMGLSGLTFGQIQTLMYLKISLSDYASVFNSRCRGWMWETAPSPIVVLAASFAMGVATYLSCFMAPGAGMQEISPQLAAYTWAYVLVWAFVQDWAKVSTYDFLRDRNIFADACEEECELALNYNQE